MTRLVLRVVAITGVLSSAALRAIDQAKPTPASIGTSIVAGRTVDAVTGAPVANVMIGLSQRTGPSSGNTQAPVAPNTQLVTVLTDGDGRFVVRDVPKGSFLLLATAPGYVITTYGQGRPTGPSRTIDLADGERLVDLAVPMWRHAVISGTITDEAGEPVVGATVRAVRRVANGAAGATRFLPATETTTDDRGQYRLAELTPGQFLVSVPQTQVTVPSATVDRYVQTLAGRGATGSGAALLELMSSRTPIPTAGGGVRIDTFLLQSSGSGRLLTIPPIGGDGRVWVYPTTFYSNNGASASLTVGPAEERAGTDLQLRPVRAVRVTGSVTTDGAPVPNVPVRLVPVDGPPLQNDADFEAATSMTDAAGRFAMLGVVPGRYVIKVTRAPRLTLPPGLGSNPAVVAASALGQPNGAIPAQVIGAAQPLIVGDADLMDVSVVLKAGATLSGRLDFGTEAPVPTPAQLQNVAVLLASEDGGNFGAGLQVNRLGPDNTFHATPPSAGRYSPNIAGLPLAWRLSAIELNGHAVTGPIDLSGDDVDGLVLRYTNRLSTIAGTIRLSSGAAATHAEVVVFPTDVTARVADALNPRQPRSGQASNAGAFRLTSLIPGEYFIAAVADADMPEIPESSFYDALARAATRVTIAAGEVRTVDLILGSIR